MTREDIIAMAREVWGTPNWNEPQIERLERFAALVAAAEREACAKECENQKIGFPSYFEIDERIQECADAIRARGNT